MRKSFFLSIATAVFMFTGVQAQAAVFAVQGGSITATKTGEDVLITVTGIPATQLVHFRKTQDGTNGIRQSALSEGKGTLEAVDKNGGRFQLRDAGGRWLLIVPVGNPYRMVGVAQECRTSAGGCALEVQQ